MSTLSKLILAYKISSHRERIYADLLSNPANEKIRNYFNRSKLKLESMIHKNFQLASKIERKHGIQRKNSDNATNIASGSKN
jgi:hypothetical protein